MWQVLLLAHFWDQKAVAPERGADHDVGAWVVCPSEELRLYGW